MFASLATVSTIFLAAVSLVSAHPIAHSELARRINTIEARGKPAGYPKSLEDYDVYHTRYNALKCQTKHDDKKFFNACCTPMRAGQKLSSRPPKCTPTKASNDDDEGDDCDDDDSPPPTKPSSTKTATSAKPTKSTTPVKSSDNDDEGGFSNTGGQATFFFQNGNPGACGKKNPDSLPLVALDTRRYGNTSRKSDDCGRYVLIRNTKNGKTVKCLVADACPTCKNRNSLDLSTGAFDALGSRKDGVLPIEWKFL